MDITTLTSDDDNTLLTTGPGISILKVEDVPNPPKTCCTSAEAFALWQTAETNASPGDSNALNAHSAQIMQVHDITSADGTGNGSNPLSQYINQVTGTDIVSTVEKTTGFTITGHANADASGSIKFWLDNDRTDGVNELGVELQDGVGGVDISYDDISGDYTLSFEADSSVLRSATHNIYGSGIHQLTVDTDGSGTKNGSEASRLFLVASGTASLSDTGTAAQNFSVQDAVTKDVFVYYYGDPDGAGVGLWTQLDKGDSANNPGIVTTDKDKNPAFSSDWDYYNNPAANANAATTPVTPGNTALHLVTDIAAQNWEFHMASRGTWEHWDLANSQAADHSAFDSNTSRLASLQELVALYAANFSDSTGGGSIAGAIQPMSNLGSTSSFSPLAGNKPDVGNSKHLVWEHWLQGLESGNQPTGWSINYWSAASSPSGHGGINFYHGYLYDDPDVFYYYNVAAVL